MCEEVVNLAGLVLGPLAGSTLREDRGDARHHLILDLLAPVRQEQGHEALHQLEGDGEVDDEALVESRSSGGPEHEFLDARHLGRQDHGAIIVLQQELGAVADLVVLVLEADGLDVEVHAKEEVAEAQSKRGVIPIRDRALVEMAILGVLDGSDALLVLRPPQG